MRRRDALAAGGLLLSGLSAGCLETLRREDAWRELVVDPPDGVYVPPHADGMVTYGTATTDGRDVSLTATRPHSFWPVAGTERSRADVRSRHALHLMVAVRDAETDVIVPASVTTSVRSGGTDGGGDTGGGGDDAGIDQRTLWPMLSQRMGPHYGDNVSLEGDGTYAATIRIGPSSAEPIGALADGLEAPTTVDLEFEYEATAIDGIERRLIDEDEGRGEPGALEPMAEHAEHGRDGDGPSLESAADSGDATRVGVEASGDIVYSAVVENDGRDETESPALAVATRTAYNRYPLPFASLSATVSRGDDRIATIPLQETIDPQYGHHYRTPVESDVLERGDELSITLETPPQVARHEGYETAFLERDAVTMALDSR